MATSNSDVAARLDIRHRRGDSFHRVFSFSSNGAPMDLTGYTAKMQLREASTTPAIIDISTDDDIAIDDNEITIAISAADMIIAAKRYLWELELTTPAGITTTYLHGTFTITQDVTQ